ncbi:MAG TPA: rhodanese-like domain-containing protein, partial [Bdellovibrionales bacterium]|nr:rhodanese-like domain-containing protein [Bdellovibrionales bacterium]
LNWSDFTEPEPAQRGIMQADLFGAARRLARLGISPESHVVVVGNGIYGNGEEGRVAWMLVYMGLSKVQFASLEALKPRVTNVIDTSSIKAVPMWKPEVRTSLNVTRDEVIFAINERGVEKPISFKGGPALVYHIIDVRSEKAYLGKEGVGSRAHVPNMDAINIPWKEFFDKQMRVKTSMAQRLAQVGLDPANRVIVIGEDGVSSAAVTLVLRGLGYKNAGNYAGGLLDLMSTKVR